MRDRGIIYGGLAVFLGLLTYPVWHGLLAGSSARGPNPALPANARQCVEPAATMRSSHMTLLMNWRQAVVRENTRDFTASDGAHYRMSLTSTCLNQCHGSKAEFCDRCHEYAAVQVTCWNCHVDAQPTLRSAR